MDAGAVDHAGLQINGGAANYQMPPDRVAVVDTLPSALTWTTVAG